MLTVYTIKVVVMYSTQNALLDKSWSSILPLVHSLVYLYTLFFPGFGLWKMDQIRNIFVIIVPKQKEYPSPVNHSTTVHLFMTTVGSVVGSTKM